MPKTCQPLSTNPDAAALLRYLNAEDRMGATTHSRRAAEALMGVALGLLRLGTIPASKGKLRLPPKPRSTPFGNVELVRGRRPKGSSGARPRGHLRAAGGEAQWRLEERIWRTQAFAHAAILELDYLADLQREDGDPREAEAIASAARASDEVLRLILAGNNRMALRQCPLCARFFFADVKRADSVRACSDCKVADYESTKRDAAAAAGSKARSREHKRRLESNAVDRANRLNRIVNESPLPDGHYKDMAHFKVATGELRDEHELRRYLDSLARLHLPHLSERAEYHSAR